MHACKIHDDPSDELKDTVGEGLADKARAFLGHSAIILIRLFFKNRCHGYNAASFAVVVDVFEANVVFIINSIVAEQLLLCWIWYWWNQIVEVVTTLSLLRLLSGGSFHGYYNIGHTNVILEIERVTEFNDSCARLLRSNRLLRGRLAAIFKASHFFSHDHYWSLRLFLFTETQAWIQSNDITRGRLSLGSITILDTLRPIALLTFLHTLLTVMFAAKLLALALRCWEVHAQVVKVACWVVSTGHAARWLFPTVHVHVRLLVAIYHYDRCIRVIASFPLRVDNDRAIIFIVVDTLPLRMVRALACLVVNWSDYFPSFPSQRLRTLKVNHRDRIQILVMLIWSSCITESFLMVLDPTVLDRSCLIPIQSHLMLLSEEFEFSRCSIRNNNQSEILVLGIEWCRNNWLALFE